MNDTSAQNLWIWGYHSVEACLECHPELVVEVQIEADVFEQSQKRPSRNAQDLGDSDVAKIAKIIRLTNECGLKPKPVPRLPKALAEKRSQGVVARLKKFPEIHLKLMIDELREQLREPLPEGVHPSQWAILDGVQDPRNYGAILRSAAAFGLEGVFVRDRNQAPLNGTVAQASAGNLFRVPIISCVSFNLVIDTFVENAHVVLGLEAAAKNIESSLKSHSAHRLWVLGGEGRGIRHGLREKCTELVSVPMAEGVESLNASAAATLAFYLASR